MSELKPKEAPVDEHAQFAEIAMAVEAVFKTAPPTPEQWVRLGNALRAAGFLQPEQETGR